MRVYTAFPGDQGEVLVIPSITPNPSQFRVGIRIGTETVYLRREQITLLIKQLGKEIK